MAAEPRTGAVYVVAHDNPGILRLLRPGETPAAAARRAPPGQAVYQQHCQTCHGAGSSRHAPTACRSCYADADPAANIAAGAPRFDAERHPRRVATGKAACLRSRI